MSMKFEEIRMLQKKKKKFTVLGLGKSQTDGQKKIMDRGKSKLPNEDANESEYFPDYDHVQPKE